MDEEVVLLLPIWLSGSGCVGDEASLLDCPEGASARGSAIFCTPRHTIELSCTSGADAGEPIPSSCSRDSDANTLYKTGLCSLLRLHVHVCLCMLNLALVLIAYI